MTPNIYEIYGQDYTIPDGYYGEFRQLKRGENIKFLSNENQVISMIVDNAFDGRWRFVLKPITYIHHITPEYIYKGKTIAELHEIVKKQGYKIVGFGIAKNRLALNLHLEVIQFQGIGDEIRFLVEKIVTEFKELALNDKTTAKVYKDKIVVGCQTFTIDKLKEIDTIVQELNSQFLLNMTKS